MGAETETPLNGDSELQRLREERLVLEKVLGTADVSEIVKLVQALEARGVQAEAEGTIASLVTQLESLYADREALVAVLGPDIVEGLRQVLNERTELEEELMRYRQAGARTDANPQIQLDDSESVESMVSLVAQLESIYNDQERFGTPMELRTQVESLVEQLESLYADREGGASDAEQTAENLAAQLVALYEEQERLGTPAELAESNESLVQQLESIYEERQGQGDQSRMIVELVSANESLLEQLEDFYAIQQERGDIDGEVEALRLTNRSLQEQLESLYAERAEAREEAERMAPVIAAIDRLGERLLTAMGPHSPNASVRRAAPMEAPVRSEAPRIAEAGSFGSGFSLRF